MTAPPFGFASVVIDGRAVLAVLSERTVHRLSDLVPDAPASFEDVLDRWDPVVDAVLAGLDAPTTPGSPSDDVVFLPPGVARPGIWCAGANYVDHVAEMGVVDPPKRSFHFCSPTTVLNGHRGDVTRPGGVTQLDWEVELVAVIGRPARNIPVEQALDVVAGYTVANDVSVRDPEWLRHPIFGVDWTSAKNADGLTPLGPAIVPSRFVPDPADLDLQLTVNGEVRQRSHSSRMIVDLREQIAALTALVTLQPGDLVLTGTPAGTAAAFGRYLDDGDVMVAEIPGVGVLENTVVGAARS